jgi:hypothetical protein
MNDIEKLALLLSVRRILFFNPLGRPRPRLIGWCITTIEMRRGRSSTLFLEKGI